MCARGLQVKTFYSFGRGLEDLRLQNGHQRRRCAELCRLGAERARTDNVAAYSAVISHGLADAPAVQRADAGCAPRSVMDRVRQLGASAAGTPITVLSGSDRNLDGVNNDRANVSGDATLPTDRSREEQAARWFDTSAFTVPALGQNGNSSRSLLDGPGLKTVDLAVFRTFPRRTHQAGGARRGHQCVQLGQPAESDRDGDVAGVRRRPAPPARCASCSSACK